MSDKIFMKEITLPIVETGENETYSFVQTDADLDTAGDAADAKAVGDEISDLKQDYNQLSETKADKTANNPSMGSGYASQLNSSLRKSDSVPYNFRKVPYDSTLEDGSIVGASVAWNQLINANSATDLYSPDSTISASNNTVTLSSTAASGNVVRFGKKGGTTSVIGHKALICGSVTASVNGGLRFYNGTSWVVDANITAGTPVSFSMIFNVGSNGFVQDTPFGFVPSSDMSGDTIAWKNPQIIDLTQMLGTTIADYVYGLETATAGSGVAWLKEHFPKQFGDGYQAYNAGEIKSISGLAEHKSVGFNQWDEVAEVGGLNISNGAETGSGDRIRSKNYIRVVPNTVYCISAPVGSGAVCFYDANKTFISAADSLVFTNNATFTTPTNCAYIRFMTYSSYGNVYNHDICINISKPTGTPKNGDYVPYESHSYALDSTKTLRGILKLDGNNQLYADGDEYLPDGTVEHTWGEVDLGSYTWTKGNRNAADTGNIFYVRDNVNVKSVAFTVCTKFVRSSPYQSDWKNLAVGTMEVDSSSYIVICSTEEDAAAFKTAVTGVKLVYEKKTPTTETAEPYSNPQIINPDGTESYVYTDGAFELPVGHTSEYPVNVSGQLDDILDTPTTNGTYTLQATVTDGVVAYEWVSTS